MKIKQLLVFVAILMLLAGCFTKRTAVKLERSPDNESVTDSIEYEMETFDSKFETWYMLQNRPSTYKTQSYYESWNRQYVAAWNSRSVDRRTGFVFETIVGYDPGVDYGFEINHELFYYFQYVEKVLKVRILSAGPYVPLL